MDLEIADMKMKLSVTLGVACLLASAVYSFAAVSLTYHDSFAYTQGNNLAGEGDWVAASGSGTIKIGAASLSYAGLTNGSGNDVALTPSGTAARTYVNFAAQSGGSFYVSFLLKVNTRPSTQSIIGFASGSTSSDTTPSLGLFVKSTGELAVGINTSSPQFSTAPLNVGETHLVVIGYTFGSTDVAEVWLNPVSLGSAMPAPTGSASGSDTATLQYFLWNTPSSGGGGYEVDDLRIGATYASVTPPSSVLPPVSPSVPVITETFVSAGNIILRGTNGTPGGGYEVLSTANVAGSWSAVSSNAFNGNGAFESTNPVNLASSQAYFRLRTAGSGGTNLPVGTPPAITSQPQSQSASIGQGALFSVAVSGSAPLSYQWYFNGTSPIPGATDASYLISAVSSNDAGGYSVIVANGLGAVTSLVATLSITPAPTNGDWFVSTTGNDANPGTMALPYATVGKAASVAGPGDVVYVRGGTYYPSQTIRITNSGTAGFPIQLLAYPGEHPFLDFTNQPYGAANRGFLFTTNGNYWRMKGFEIARAGDNAIKVESSHCTFELLTLHHNGDTGLQIGFAHETDNPGANLAAYITVLNCDSYLNYDPDSNGGDADGFAAKLHCGQGIVFQGCRAWENSDDGWDLFETDASVVISNCWTWKSGVGQGNGNGFKLGGDGSGGNSMGIHYAYNCVSFSHKVNCFTQNSHRDGLVVQHCLAFAPGNSGYNFFMEGTLNSGRQNVFRNNVSIPRSGLNTGGFIADNNPVEQNNTWNLAVTANGSDYVNVAEAAAKEPRLPDGSLPTGFARLVAGSDLIDKGVVTGLPFNGTAPDLGPYER